MKQQILFVCGCDMTGKTQIAKALAKKLNIPYFKASNEHDSYKTSSGFYGNINPEQNLFLMQLQHADPRVFDLFKQCGFSIVADRAFPCEQVYSSVFKRTTDEKMLKHLDESWASIGAKIIICTRSSYKGIIDDLDSRINDKKLQELDDAYKIYAQKTNCKCMILNVDDENLDREVNDIINWLKNVE